MADNTGIQWTDSTWNPWQGCFRVSPGCDNCYMYRDMKRYNKIPNHVVRSKTTFGAPLKWKEGRKVFVCSWSDFFIKQADPWRDEAWDIIRRTPQHTYQILTKRPERIADHLPADWGKGYPNAWLGVSTENQEQADKRIPLLIDIPAVVHFLSVEPMLGPVDLWRWEYLIDWIVVGGESGPNARTMRKEWALDIGQFCRDTNAAFFFKQWGGKYKKDGHWGGNELDGKTYQQFPDVPAYREPEQLELF